MANSLYKVDIFKSFGSRKSRDQFRTVHHIAGDFGLTDDTVRTSVDRIVAAERASLVSSVHMLRAHIVQVADNILNQPTMMFRTIELSGVGLRVVETIDNSGPAPIAVQNVVPPDVCVLMTKETLVGRPGAAHFRGMLTKADIVIGLDQNWELTPAARGLLNAGVIAGLQLLTADGLYAIKGSHNAFVTGSRFVEHVKLAGIIMRQQYQKKTSIASAERDVVMRRLQMAYNAVKKLFQPGGLTWATAGPSILAAANAAKKAAEEMWDALPAEDRAALLAGGEAAEIITFLAIV